MIDVVLQIGLAPLAIGAALLGAGAFVSGLILLAWELVNQLNRAMERWNPK